MTEEPSLNSAAPEAVTANNNFVLTPSARKIFLACDFARESHTPVILSGPSQIGKTWALRQYQATHNHGRTILIEVEAACGRRGLIRAAAAASGISARAADLATLSARLKKPGRPIPW